MRSVGLAPLRTPSSAAFKIEIEIFNDRSTFVRSIDRQTMGIVVFFDPSLKKKLILCHQAHARNSQIRCGVPGHPRHVLRGGRNGRVSLLVKRC
jgi:hypothetical protein